MSWLGEFRRVPAARLEEIRARPADAYDRIVALAGMLDLDRAWQRLSALMDRAGFPVNPIAGGTPFPDASHAFGREGDSRALSADQVAAAAAHLARTPFDELAVHLRAQLESEEWVAIKELAWPPEPVAYQVDEEMERALLDTLAESYKELVAFFAEAAAEQECTVFWAE
ncbi:DUF1877 family protein [Paractinoplanes durhamensis]|uniref:DUF1877 family protein n=1 Tax=Paractinoplanes durhamensis TaxID=113563 RepID=A0ABQ3Z9B1_9ACTN|nr:DUF1877 family protein [Actinoplanes durhamensis]GIE06415.1 hypothetical protein Adu01nite_77650 [Actinoplanes durhamensis]